MNTTIELVRAKQTDSVVRFYVTNHYTQPRGFIGRVFTYLIKVDDDVCGVIVGGSTSLHQQGRKEFFGLCNIQDIINNRLFRLENNQPNLGSRILKVWRNTIVKDWEDKYQCKVIGFETLVKPPRDGAVYKADNWIFTGTTKGYTAHKCGTRQWKWIKTEPRLIFSKRV